MSIFTVHHINSIKELRGYSIYSEMPYTPHVEDVDFLLIGFEAVNTDYLPGGIKYRTQYADWNGNICIEKEFVDTIIPDPENSDTFGVTIIIKWWKSELDENGEDIVGVEKIIFKKLDVIKWEERKEMQRNRAITYLESKAKGTAIEPFVTAIFTHYSNYPYTNTGLTELNGEPIIAVGNLIYHFTKNGDNLFAWAVQNETDPVINGYLDIEILRPDGTSPTVRDNILEQITAG